MGDGGSLLSLISWQQRAGPQIPGSPHPADTLPGGVAPPGTTQFSSTPPPRWTHQEPGVVLEGEYGGGDLLPAARAVAGEHVAHLGGGARVCVCEGAWGAGSRSPGIAPPPKKAPRPPQHLGPNTPGQLPQTPHPHTPPQNLAPQTPPTSWGVAYTKSSGS